MRHGPFRGRRQRHDWFTDVMLAAWACVIVVLVVATHHNFVVNG